MSGQTKMLLVLGGTLALGIGAVVWAVIGDSPENRRDDAASAGTAGDKPVEDGTTTAAARRPKKAGSASIVGFVRRSKGKVPVPGQEVELLPEKGDPWTVKTDAQGAFALTSIPHGGPYELRVAADKCGTIRIPGIALDRNERRDVGTLWLDPSVKVAVEVRSWGDAAVEGALVEAYAVAQPENFDWTKAYAQMAQAPISVAKATTDAAGRVVFPELATGRWTFTAQKQGFARAGRTNVTIRADADPPPVKLYLGTGHSLTGRVLNAAKTPVASATVSTSPPNAAWDLGSSALRSRCTTDAEGHYTLDSLEAGDLSLLVGRPGGGVPSQVATVRIPNVKQFDVTLGATATLSGTVTEKEGAKPVEGATVRAWSYGPAGSNMAEATSDADGKYALTVTEGTVSQVNADKEGWVTAEEIGRQQTQIPIREGESRTRDIQLRRGSKVTGVVKGPDGPLAGAKVWVHSGAPDRGWTQKSATTDAEGRYEVTSIPAGRSVVRAEYAGFYVKDFPEQWWGLMQQAGPSPFKVEVPEAGEATKDIDMARGVPVSGRVEGPEGPLAGARVASGLDTEGGVVTGADGAFQLDGVKPSANVQLMLSKDGYAPSSANKPFAVSSDAPATGIVLRMTNVGSVRGNVTTSDGGALTDARVTVTPVRPGGDWQPMQYGGMPANQAAPVRADGSYEVPLGGISSGTFRVGVTALDRPAAQSDPQPIVDGQAEYVVNVTMDAGRDLAGRVVAKPGSAPVPDALVSVQSRGSRSGRGEMMTSMGGGGGGQTVWAVTDADGRFSVPHLALGSYSVQARADHYVSGNATVDLASASQVTVELESEMSIEGTVKFGDGTPAEGAQVNAARDQGVSAGGAPVPGMNGPGSNAWAIVGSGGRFRLTGVVAGNYRISVSPDWQGEVNIRQKTTDPIAAGTADVKIVVESGGVIAGRVVDQQKKGLAGMWVYVSPELKDGKSPEGMVNRQARTKDDGTFTATGLNEGVTYQLLVRTSQGWDAGGSTLRNATVKGVSVGARGLEIVLEEGLSITGTVSGTDGKPLGSVYLTCTPGSRESGQQSRNTMTDGDGAFTFAGLDPGDCAISLQAWGGTNEGLVLENGEKIPAGTRDARLVASKGVTISGTATDERGAAVTQGMITATGKAGGRSRNARVKEDGTFEITGLAGSTTYKLIAQAPGRASARIDDVAAGAANVHIVLAKGLESAGSVRDEDGNPVKQGQIQLRLVDDPDIRAYAQTDDEGAFKVQGLAEGVYDAECFVRTAANRGYRKCGTLKAGDTAVALRILP
jgi:protocatechuate 3,4-dioxygenase beta subunit